MNFAFTEEQNLLRESLSRYLRDKYGFEQRKDIIASDEGWSRKIWADFAQMGLMAAAFPEEMGGFGGTAIDQLVIMEEFGKALIVEPYLPTVVLCGQILRAIEGQTAMALIEQIIEGSLVMGFAHTEPTARFNLSHVATTAQTDGTSYKLNGHKAVVLAAPIADKFIISARTSDDTQSESGISLFLVDAKTDGVQIENYPTIDGLQAGDIILDNVTLPTSALLGRKDDAFTVIDAITNNAIIALSAESIGLCQNMLTLTQDYCRGREQFGQPISSFQVSQHKMVDMFIHTEEMISIAYMAAMKSESVEDDTARAASTAKVQLAKSLKFVGETAIQLHGGMGITEEMAVGHYFMHGTMLEPLFGNARYHLERYKQNG